MRSMIYLLAFACHTPLWAANIVGTEPELVLDTGGFLSQVSDITFSPDGRMVAVAGDKLVRIYAVESGALVKTLRGDRSRSSYGATNAVAYSADGKYLLVGVYDYHPRGSIRVYRTDNLDKIDRLLPGHQAPCSSIRFSRDGRYMASADADGEICLWNWSTQQVVKRIPVRNPEKPIIDCMMFADDAPYLVTVEYDRPHVYHVPSGREMQAHDNMPPKVLGWLFDVLTSRVAWPHDTSPDKQPRVFDLRLDGGAWVATGQGGGRNANRYWVGLWGARNMQQNAPRNTPRVVYDKHRWRARAVAVSPRGDLVASGDKFGEVHLWEAETGKPRHVIRSQGQSIYEAAFDNHTGQIAFSTRPDIENWNFNHYGVATKVIDLGERVIRDVAPQLNTKQETTAHGNTRVQLVSPSTGQQSYRITKQKGGQTVSTYRLPSGLHPSVYTMLPQPRLGVDEPILFGVTDGLLAMWNSSTDEMQRYYRGHLAMITSISPAANGKVFVTGSTDRTMRIWSLVNHQRTGIFDFKYENATVIQVKPGTSSAKANVRVGDRIVSIDGKSLQDMYELMMLGLFDYQPGQIVPVVMRRDGQDFQYQMRLAEGFDYVEPLLNIFVGAKDEWIMWTPKGYYDCSPGADRLIGWHVNQGPAKPAKFFQAGQFRKKMYRPDVINAIIATGDVDQAIQVANDKYPHRGQGLDLTDHDVMAKNAPPVVTFAPVKREPGELRVTIQATAIAENELAISSVTLLHNGTPAKVFKPTNGQDRRRLEISFRTRLFPGRNEFSLIAANVNATSAPQDARMIIDAPAGQRRSKVYVLAIGIGDYANAGVEFQNLKYAAEDARAFVAATQKHHNGKLYSEVESRLLIDQEATRTNVLNNLQWLVDNVQQDDVVMLFAACHGFLEKDNFYLATHEVDKRSLRATGISWREITGTLHEELPACKRIVFLDACHSAGIVGGDSRNPLHDLSSPELGTVFYASCTVQQKSFESPEWRHGAFTKAILDILGDPTADFSPRTGDGLISTLELEQGVADKVHVITRDRQHPVVFVPPLLGRFNLLELQK